MIEDIQLAIVELFARDFSRELTIRQISKIVNKSYGFVNKETRILLDIGVLNKKIVGAAILCSLNLKSDLTLALLAMGSVLEKQEYLSQRPKQKSDLEAFVPNVVERSLVYCMLATEKKILVICENEIQAEEAVKQYAPQGYEIRIVEGANFTPDLVDGKSVVVYGFETFWRLMNVG